MQVTGNNIQQDSLSIRFSADGFSFSANGKTKSVTFNRPDNDFTRSRAICLCEPEIWNDYKHVVIEIDDEPSAMVPAQIFSENDYRTILTFNFPKINLSNYSIESQYIDGFDITNVIAVSNDLNNFIKEYLPYATITHTTSKLVSQALKSSKAKERKELWIHVSADTLTVALTNNGSLLLSNRYQIESEIDILYWIGAIYTHYSLSQKSTPLFISGNTECAEILKEHIADCNTYTL